MRLNGSAYIIVGSVHTQVSLKVAVNHVFHEYEHWIVDGNDSNQFNDVMAVDERPVKALISP